MSKIDEKRTAFYFKDQKTWQLFQLLCKMDKRTASDVIRELIDDYIERNKSKVTSLLE